MLSALKTLSLGYTDGCMTDREYLAQVVALVAQRFSETAPDACEYPADIAKLATVLSMLEDSE